MLHEEVVGHTLVLTLDRPEARNAINRETAQALDAAMGRLEGDDDLWLAVLQHEGPVFCAGADLKEISAEGGVSTLHTPLGGFGGVVRYPRTKPMIAAVDGPAVAGGLEIVLTCDLVVASTRAAFGFPEVKRGLIAGAGGPFRLARVVGRNVAAELAMTGETMSADRAHQLGLVNRLVEPGTVREAAMELAEQIAANAPVAVRRSRELVNASFDLDETQLWALNKQLQDIVHATEDFKEGPKAFVEKRPPRWLGR
jgi:enoyl-CoA hydratase